MFHLVNKTQDNAHHKRFITTKFPFTECQNDAPIKMRARETKRGKKFWDMRKKSHYAQVRKLKRT